MYLSNSLPTNSFEELYNGFIVWRGDGDRKFLLLGTDRASDKQALKKFDAALKEPSSGAKSPTATDTGGARTDQATRNFQADVRVTLNATESGAFTADIDQFELELGNAETELVGAWGRPPEGDVQQLA